MLTVFVMSLQPIHVRFNWRFSSKFFLSNWNVNLFYSPLTRWANIFLFFFFVRRRFYWPNRRTHDIFLVSALRILLDCHTTKNVFTSETQQLNSTTHGKTKKKKNKFLHRGSIEPEVGNTKWKQRKKLNKFPKYRTFHWTEMIVRKPNESMQTKNNNKKKDRRKKNWTTTQTTTTEDWRIRRNEQHKKKNNNAQCDLTVSKKEWARDSRLPACLLLLLLVSVESFNVHNLYVKFRTHKTIQKNNIRFEYE